MTERDLLALAIAAFSGLAGCGVDGASPEADADRDGLTAADGDCDDFNNRVHPGAAETSRDGLDADCDGEDGPVVTDEVPGVMPFEEFLTACDARGGLAQLHAACAGSNDCRGMSYGDWGEGSARFEHTCRAMNYCNGWSCVETAAGEARDGAAVYEAKCAGCHGWNGPLVTTNPSGAEVEIPQFTVMVAPGTDPEAALAAFAASDDEAFRSAVAFGLSGRVASGRAFANMPGFHESLSRAEIDAVIAHVRTMPLTTHAYTYPDGAR